MAMAVVDHLETVHVEQDHHRAVAAVSVALLHPLVQRAPVQQPGQFIGAGQLAQLAGQGRALPRLFAQHFDGIKQALHLGQRVGHVLRRTGRVRGDLDHLLLRLQQWPQDLQVGNAQGHAEHHQRTQRRCHQHHQAHGFTVAGVLETGDGHGQVTVAQRFQRLQGRHVACGELGGGPRRAHAAPAIVDQPFDHRQRFAEELPARHVPMPGQPRITAVHRFMAAGQPPQLQQAAFGLQCGTDLFITPCPGTATGAITFEARRPHVRAGRSAPGPASRESLLRGRH